MIYFDNAATTFPKPRPVIDEVFRCMTSYCGNPGRSGHTLSLEAARKIFECRELISRGFGSSFPTNVVFTCNTTFALNIAINAFAKKNTHILISDIEHNSVYRAVCALSKNGTEHDIFKVFPDDIPATLRSLRSGIRRNTSMVVCSHVSNVCGITSPIEEIGAVCAKFGIRFIVDGAQSAGTHRIDISKSHIDALCCPGHKGLYGPQGTGFVLFADKYADQNNVSKLNNFVYGGNGVNSADKNMPDFLPEKYEGGTLNTVGIAGLCEGIRFVNSIGEKRIFEKECRLTSKAIDMVSSVPGSTVYCGPCQKGSCVLFNLKGVPPDKVADELNKDGICVRAGLHCSPLAHKKLKTNGGAVRASFSCFNELSELDVFYRSLKNIAFTG